MRAALKPLNWLGQRPYGMTADSDMGFLGPPPP